MAKIKFIFDIDTELNTKVEKVCEKEHRTKTSLARVALDTYCNYILFKEMII